MTKILMIGILALTVPLISGCDKERIVTSTEYVHDIEYIELPPDTVFLVDTLLSHDSVLIYTVDTVVLYDTTIQIILDTVIQVINVSDTVFIYDTVVTVEQHFDTVIVTDTVLTTQCLPNEHFAFAALQYYSDPLVLNLVYQQFGFTNGWVLYLSEFQSSLSARSSDVYDIYGYINYWTVGWSGYYLLEYYWRLSFMGGDPADPRNWRLSEPPRGASSGPQPGLKLFEDTTHARSARR